MTTPTTPADVLDDVYVVTGPNGFTEGFGRREIDLMERVGLIRHQRDGYVLEDGNGNGVGRLHRFYVAADLRAGESE